MIARMWLNFIWVWMICVEIGASQDTTSSSSNTNAFVTPYTTVKSLITIFGGSAALPTTSSPLVNVPGLVTTQSGLPIPPDSYTDTTSTESSTTTAYPSTGTNLQPGVNAQTTPSTFQASSTQVTGAVGPTSGASGIAPPSASPKLHLFFYRGQNASELISPIVLPSNDLFPSPSNASGTSDYATQYALSGSPLLSSSRSPPPRNTTPYGITSKSPTRPVRQEGDTNWELAAQQAFTMQGAHPEANDTVGPLDAAFPRHSASSRGTQYTSPSYNQSMPPSGPAHSRNRSDPTAPRPPPLFDRALSPDPLNIVKRSNSEPDSNGNRVTKFPEFMGYAAERERFADEDESDEEVRERKRLEALNSLEGLAKKRQTEELRGRNIASSIYSRDGRAELLGDKISHQQGPGDNALEKKPFLNETHEEFMKSLDEYVGGAFAFSQEVVNRYFEENGEGGLEKGGGKKGTLIFTGALGALRCSAEYAAYGAGRASVRQLAQTLAREMSPKGIHIVHTIANGAIEDNDGEDQKIGKKMSADAVGKTYLWLSQQGPELWTHELDMRPAAEKF
ncbi:hypothetical protein G7Y89_g7030 [Cudoniella acicularis]|uniref:Uncharacterized protein n=1 Tax=Cudoniella acicularis TaxID=354080 RepID=A0A8H4W1X1_9HELO|nr:hypothetical protein G7Y89_g7030 [Cudoniella acicularis]